MILISLREIVKIQIMIIIYEKMALKKFHGVIWHNHQIVKINTKVNWKVHRLTKILTKNVTKWGLFSNIVTLVAHTFLTLVLQCLHPVGQRNHLQQIWHHKLFNQLSNDIFNTLADYYTNCWVSILMDTPWWYGCFCSNRFLWHLNLCRDIWELHTFHIYNYIFSAGFQNLFSVIWYGWKPEPRMFQYTSIYKLVVHSRVQWIGIQ